MPGSEAFVQSFSPRELRGRSPLVQSIGSFGPPSPNFDNCFGNADVVVTLSS